MDGSPSSVYLLLIAANVVASLAGRSSPQIIRNYAILHVDLGHLFMNMFTLFFFGRALEFMLGGPRFLVLYLGSLLFGSLATLVFHRHDPTYRAIGASGAVSGVVFGFILFSPFSRIYMFLLPVGIPAILFGIGYIALSIYGARTRLGRIGHAAHLGGAIGGMILTMILYPDVIRIFLSHFR